MPEIVLTDKYKKKAISFLKRHPQLFSQYKKTLIQLQKDPTHPSLRLHKLHGKLQDLYSVSINMKFRILLEFIVKDDRIILIHIGSHDQMYG